MIALWDQKARQTGAPRPGFVPPLLYAMQGGGFLDITQGGNSIFGVNCCTAAPGFDLASGLGSPIANEVAARLVAPKR